jgi:hypothetical protein
MCHKNYQPFIEYSLYRTQQRLKGSLPDSLKVVKYIMLSDPNEISGAADEAEGEYSDELSPDAMPLCPKCLKPVDPKDYYCPYCGSDEPINPLTAYMPFVRLRYMYSVFGAMWRRLWDGKTGLLVSLLFVLLIIVFAPILLIVGTPIAGYKLLRNVKLRNSRSISLLIIISGIVVFLLLGWVVSIVISLGF